MARRRSRGAATAGQIWSAHHLSRGRPRRRDGRSGGRVGHHRVVGLLQQGTPVRALGGDTRRGAAGPGPVCRRSQRLQRTWSRRLSSLTTAATRQEILQRPGGTPPRPDQEMSRHNACSDLYAHPAVQRLPMAAGNGAHTHSSIPGMRWEAH